MKNITSGVVISFLVGVVLGVFIIPSFMSPSGRYGMGMMWGGSNSSRVSENVDRHFIEQMIPHHDGAIAMAKLTLEKSKRSEILLFAGQIIEAQEKEITDMENWYKEWYGKDVSEYSSQINGMMNHGSMSMGSFEGDVSALNNAKDFDLEFIKQMIPHHEMAVMMAQMLLVGTSRSEMKTLANNIITSQSREIEMMRGWINLWSNVK